MLVQSASRSSGPGPQLLRLLLTSSHSQQQQTAAAARAYATGDDARSQEGGQLQRYGQRSRRELSAAQQEETVFDARAASEPLRVHQLIGDPRSGVADDTTTVPFSNDIKVEHLIEVPPRREGQESTHWFRYSMAGAALPYMYMDSRLSDHSKNLMYLLRAKDPARWTIPALADKFRIRRQRVMAILAFKEIQAHKIQACSSMAGPLSHYVYNVPLNDLSLDEHGQPKDLMQLVTEQAAAQQQQLQQQQQQPGAAAAAAAGVQTLESAEGLGSLEEFLAVDGGSSSQQAGTAAGSSSGSSGAGVSTADQAADLAVLMPHIAFTAQQLQLQLLQLLQTHHYSVAELQRRLLQQIDVAEAYYKAHIEGTPLQDLLMGASSSSSSSSADTQQTAAAAAAEQQEEGEAAADSADAASGAAAAVPSFLDFVLQRQAVQQLTGLLEPLLSAAGPQAEREAGRLLVALQAALEQQQQQQGASPTAAAAAAAADAGSDGAPEAAAAAAGGQQQQQQGLSELVGAAAPATLVSAFNSLPVEQRQQLLDAVPSARITLNIQGSDLQAALSSSSSSSSSQDESAAAASSSSSSSPGEWPGQVPTLVDVWGYEEVPRQDLSALLEALPGLQALLGQEGVGTLARLSGAARASSSSSSSKMGAQDIAAVQQAVQVYSGLLLHYDLALTDQAIAATGSEAAAVLPPTSQRRLARILRELDPHALQKLLLWESVFKEEAEGGSSRRLNRLRMRVQATVKALDKQAAASSGYRPPYEDYPDLPASVRAEGRGDNEGRRDKDMLAAKLEAEVVGRQFHRGSGDRPYVSVPTYPRFEGLTLEEFDATREGEISIINRLAAERQDNVMWREFRTRLLRNMGLLAPDLAQHSGIVKPPKPAAGWSWVVHPVGGAAKAAARERLRVESAVQWEDEQQDVGAMRWYAEQDLQGRPAVRDPARDPAPVYPYVAEPGGRFRALNEEEAVVAGDTRPKPRPRWFVNKRG